MDNLQSVIPGATHLVPYYMDRSIQFLYVGKVIAMDLILTLTVDQ